MSTYKPTVIIDGRENQLDNPDGLDAAHVANVDYIDFDILYVNSSQEGRLQWNSTDGTLEVGMPGGNVTLQIGQEQLVRCRNTTGSTINNGSVVHISSQSGNKPLIALSQADDKSTAIVFGMTTEDILHNEDGYVNVGGLVRSVNTFGLTEGSYVFLSANTAGGMEIFPATAPSFKARVGYCLRTHNSEGVILVDSSVVPQLKSLSDCYGTPTANGDHLTWVTANNRFEVTATKSAFFNGTFRESFDFLLSSNGTAITGSLEQSGGGGDLTMQFSDGETPLDCTPAQTLNITPGTDSTPIGYMVYIPQDTKTLTIDTAWPTFTQHIKVAYILVPSATYVLTYLGGYINQNWNDHLSSGGATVNDQGHLAHIGVRIRQAGADWYSGVSGDGATDSYFTINTGNVYWQSTEGIVHQFHSHIFTAKDTASIELANVVNDPDSTYSHIQNLYTGITKDSTGNTISNNRYFNLVFWGVANKTGDGDWLMINLPSGVYTSEERAVNDDNNHDNYNFPREFDIESGTAFLICRVTFQMGVNGWTWVQTEDLRGLSPNKAAGGVGTNDHGSLGGLADDDHTQYSLVDGTRAFTGNVTVQGTVNAQAYDTGNYRIDETSSRLQIINQLDSGDTHVDFIPDKNGGDGEDDIFLHIWSTGGVSSEYLTIGYESDLAPQRYVFETFAVGGGVHHPIYFKHSGSDVMYIDSDGLTIVKGAEITVNSGNVSVNSGNVAVDGGDVTVNSGNIAVTNGTITIDDAEVLKVLDATTTIYLRTTGDDSNGGYASDDAFLTPERAITETRKWNPGDYILSVNVGDGTFNCSATIDSSHVDGQSVTWVGVATEYTSRTINNIDGSATALSTGLEYIDFDVSLPAASGAAVGQHLLIKTTSGGTNPNLVKGCHEIVTWNGTSNIATVRCVRAAGVTTLPSGTITANTLTLVLTTFNFSASHGLSSSGINHCGIWNKLVVKGSFSYTGVLMLRGASISLGTNFATSKWGTNLQCQYGSIIQADASVHSYSNVYIVTSSSGGFISLRTHAILSGCRTNALRSFDGSVINFQDGEIYCGGASLNVQALRGSYITAVNSIVQGCTPSISIAFYVTSGGGIDSSGATDDAATSRDQEGAPGGNGSYHAY